MAASSPALHDSVKDTVAWINEHKRLPARLGQRARRQGQTSDTLTVEEQKEDNIARRLSTLRAKSRKGELPVSAANQLSQVSGKSWYRERAECKSLRPLIVPRGMYCVLFVYRVIKGIPRVGSWPAVHASKRVGSGTEAGELVPRASWQHHREEALRSQSVQ